MSAVLIVEDEKHLADGLRFNIEAEGYEVDAVNDGEAALALLLEERRPYACVVLDVMLPGKDGFEVASELRQAGQFVPVLMLTALGRPEDVLRGFESGADDYLPKPFDIADLRRVAETRPPRLALAGFRDRVLEPFERGFFERDELELDRFDLVSPFSRRILFTVRAATSSARRP